MDNCLRAAGMVTALRLIDKYSPQHGEQTGAALASAVANELFGASPGNDAGRKFLTDNKTLVESQLRTLTSETEICRIVSILAHTKLNVASGSGTVTPEMVMWIAKLKDCGILIPSSEITLPSTPDNLRQEIRSFEIWSMQSK